MKNIREEFERLSGERLPRASSGGPLRTDPRRFVSIAFLFVALAFFSLAAGTCTHHLKEGEYGLCLDHRSNDTRLVRGSGYHWCLGDFAILIEPEPTEKPFKWETTPGSSFAPDVPSKCTTGERHVDSRNL